jgi:hypothetical protein
MQRDGVANGARARRAAALARARCGVELHAHVNGCVRDATLLELARARGLGAMRARARVDRDLLVCFEIFSSCIVLRRPARFGR